MKLQIEDVSKNFRTTKALDHVNLTIKPGVFGLLGPNGAGKTTLMKCILGLYSYKGNIRFHSEGRKEFRQGYLPQHFDVLRELTVEETLRYLGHVKKIKDFQEIDVLLEQVNMSAYRKRKMKALSGGMKRRVGIAQAFMGNPDIIIIDEPTAGLDPGERISFIELLSSISKDKITIISTHIVEGLEAIADSIGFLKEGKIVKEGSLESLVGTLRDKVGKIVVLPERLAEIEKNYTVISKRQSEKGYTLKILGDYLPKEAEVLTPSLHDVYFSQVGPMYEKNSL